jgi:hypothetical protein
MTEWLLSNESVVQRLTPPGKNFFFGYYDKCPWNKTEEKLLAGCTSVSGRQPDVEDVLTVGYMDLKGDGAFHPVGETTAWNFQQGAMLQWIGDGADEKVLFNTSSDGRAFGRVVHQDGSHARNLEWPVYSASQNGETVASVDFGRLAWLREGYGYAGVQTRHSRIPAPEADGLRVLDLKTGKNKLIVSYAELALAVLPRGDGAPHWIDHIEFNFHGDYLVFLHRWLAADGDMLTRVMSVNVDGTELRCLLDCGSAGHGLWLGEYDYGIWGRRSNLTGAIRSKSSSFWLPLHLGIRLARKLVPRTFKSRIHGDSLFVFDVRDGSSAMRLNQVPHEFRGGHPVRHPTMENYIICDAILSSSQGDRFLYLASLETALYWPLLALGRDPAVESPSRCDFHPRWDRSGRRICVDCSYGQDRGMYEINLSSVLSRL